jgi:phosphoglycerol geranylgeranyltransferase
LKQLESIASAQGQVALLIDPEKVRDESYLVQLVRKAEFAGVRFFFVGGSTVTRKDTERVVEQIKSLSEAPVILFPGASHQLSEKADALLFLNLISGRNPDYLIGHHVQCAEEVLASGIETIPTGYILIDGGKNTSVAYVSQTTPIPREQTGIARQTAIAGVLMGQKIIYFDAGSGANLPVPSSLIREIKSVLPGVPVIAGGGIRSAETMKELSEAGVNLLVIGNKIEEDMDFLLDIKDFVSQNAHH